MELISWNVNGYNDVKHQTLMALIMVRNPDVIFLSETKKSVDVLTPLFNEFNNYSFIINAHDPCKYHGVAMLIRNDHSFVQIPVNLPIPARSDTKNADPTSGRILSIAIDEQYYIIGTYSPNSGCRGLKNLDYRTQKWDPALFNLLNYYRSQGPTIWLGDINVAPNEIDVSNPRTMEKLPGFTIEERTSFSQFMNTGWIDIWRHQHPDKREYSWIGSRDQPNYGLRLDNTIISPDLLHYITDSFMLPHIKGSDHIPIGITIKN